MKAKTVNGQTFNATVKETAAAINGYTVDEDTKSVTITTGENKIVFIYTKRADLSYTVHYYWNGTTEEVAKSKNVTGQTFDTTATEKPIKVDGYTAVNPEEEKTFRIGVTNEDVIFYYYKNVTVTADDKSKTYGDADPKLTATATTVTGPVSEDTVKYALNREAGKDVGTYAITPSGEAIQGNYTVTYKPGTLTITPVTDKVTVTITGNTKTVTYDGKEHTVDGYSVSIDNALYTEADFTFSGEAKVENTDAGTYPMGLKAEQFKNTSKNFTNVTFVVAKDGWLKINPYMISIEPKETTFKYDGKAPEVNAGNLNIIGENGEGLLPGHKIASIETQGSGVDAGTYEWFSGHDAKIDDGSGHDVTANYQISYTAKTMTITKRNVTLTSASAEKVYDGNPLANDKVTVGGDRFAEGEGATYAVTGRQTDAGESENAFTYKLWDNTKAKNYDITVKFGTLKVTPVTDKVTVTIAENSARYTYDGTEKYLNGFTLKKISNPLYTEADFKFIGTMTQDAYAHGVDAGTYPMNLKPEHFENISTNFTNVMFVVRDGQLTIEQYAILITPDDVTTEYSGKAPEVEKYTIDGEKPEGLLPDHRIASYETYGSGVDVGEYDQFSMNNAKILDGNNKDVTKNYSISYEESKLVITPAPLTVTTEGGSKVYDGNALINKAGNIEGLVNGETATLKTTGSQTEVGTSDNTYEIVWDGTAKEANYTIKKETLGVLEVTAKGIESTGMSVGTLKDVTYNGQPQKQKPEAKDGNTVLEEGTDYTLSYSKDTTNVGTVTVTVTGKGNYSGTVTRTYKITPATLKITTNSAEKTYDGSALTAGGELKGLVKGETATLKTTGSQTEVGESKNTYEIVWDGTAKEANYKIAEEDIGMLKVNARSGGGSSSKPTPEDEPTPTPTPTPLPTLPTTPAPTTPARRVTRSTATVTQPASRPTEQITENETPKAESEPEVIEDEETPLAPMAGGAWALVNLILMLLTVLASLLLLLGYLGKKKYAKEDEYGNALHDANGNEIIDYTRNKKGFWRVASLIPAIAAVIAFALTENMRLPMVMTDRWTLLMVIIAVVQLIVAVLCKKKKESEEDENQANA